MRRMMQAAALAAASIGVGGASWAQNAASPHQHGEHKHGEHKNGEHQHGEHQAAEPVAPPKVFLDKSPKIVAFQLNRLDNQRLLLVERKTDHPKYAPVFRAILTRGGMSPQDREDALQALMTLHKSDAATELLQALETLDQPGRQQQRTLRQLATMLLKLKAADLKLRTAALQTAAASEVPQLRPVGYAGLIAAGADAEAWELANGRDQATDFLEAISLIPAPQVRASLRPTVVAQLDSETIDVQRAAVAALAHIPSEEEDTFRRVAPLVARPALRDAAVRTLLQIPAPRREPRAAADAVDVLVRHAETTPADGRTSPAFLSAMQLADQLLARMPEAASKAYRARLREVTVRVVLIHTIEEEMRYDTPFFAVEAGRPVQVVLQNEDLMPHNLVVVLPGALKEVAEEGAALGPQPGFEGKFYVPRSDKVLQATGMVPSGQLERLTFTAPSEPGEYPFVCTFPRHWMRMYGVMIVVPDLDAWSRNPTQPKDPVSNRSFVKSWTLEDLTPALEAGLKGRSVEIGRRIFAEATCAQCHKAGGAGGAVGPDLTEVFKRWKGDSGAVLREILEPSHRIEAKYAMHVVRTIEGEVISGIVTQQDKQTVSILDNPETPQPKVIQRDDIDEMIQTSKSMMPKALLDRFTQDEIYELLAFLKTLEKP